MGNAGTVTVNCPLCGVAVEVRQWDAISRTDALVGHIASEHVGKAMPPLPNEGPPLPKVLGVKWPWKK